MTGVPTARPTSTAAPTAAPAPRSLILLVAAIVLGGVPVAVVGGPGARAVGAIIYPAYACIGALLAIRRPRNPIGWLLIGFGWTFLVPFVPVLATAAAFQAGTASAFAMLTAWSSAWVPTSGFVGLLIVMIIFPAGHLPTGRWRGPAVIAIAAASLAVVLAALVPTISVTTQDGSGQRVVFASPLTLLPDTPPWNWLTQTLPYPVFIGLLIGGMGSMVVRARRARGMERQQLRWVVAAFAAVTGAVPCGFLVLIVFGDAAREVAWLPAVVAFPLPPIAIGIAIMRYRLYEIDRIISRTISYGAVSATLVTVYGVLILLLQAPLGAFTGGETIAVAVSTLVSAALFQPLRRRIHVAVDRRFNRARYDAQRTVDAFAEQLRDEVDLTRIRTAFVATADDAMRPTKATVWLRVGSGVGR